MLSSTENSNAPDGSNAQRQLSEIKGSTAWRVVQALWRIRLWLAPRGSTQERLLLFLKWAGSALRRSGFREMVRGSRESFIGIGSRMEEIVLRSRLQESELVENREKWLPTARCFRVLYVNGMMEAGESPRYRIDNIREAMGLKGFVTSVIAVNDLPEKLASVHDHDLAVLFRACWDDRIRDLIDLCRVCNVPTVFDIDDYAFGFGHTDQRYGDIVPGWSRKLLDWYVNTTVDYHRTLIECDYFTGSTHYLVGKAEGLGKPAFIIRNGLSRDLIEISMQARLQRWFRERDDEVLIIYASGTRSHQRDFAIAVPSLARILKEKKQVGLMIIGHLNLDEYDELRLFMRRIVTFPFAFWKELPGIMAKADINIAPLEIGVPFCEAKSELKYFEAAAVGLPTVASATDTFRRAITDGENGLLCRTSEDWYDALDWLIENPREREALAEGAYRHSMAQYGPSSVASEAVGTYREIIRSYRSARGRGEKDLEVAWILPDAGIAAQAYETIQSVAAEFSRRGHQVLFFSKDDGTHVADRIDNSSINRYLEMPHGLEIVAGVDHIWSSDLLIASDPSTAIIVNEHRDRTFLPCFFVQDFAPRFLPVSSVYFDMEQAYSLDLFQVVVGRELADFLSHRSGRDVKYIDHWIDRSIFYPSKGPRGARFPPKVLFEVEPASPGDQFWFSMAALMYLLERNPSVVVQVWGRDELIRRNLGFPHQWLDDMTKRERGELYRSVDLCLTTARLGMSSTAKEMMACGLPTVNIESLANYGQTIGSEGEQREFGLALVGEALVSLICNSQQMERLAGEGIEKTARFQDASSAFGKIVDLFEEEVHSRWESA